MAGFQPGPIQGEATRRALVPEAAAADRVKASSEQAALDAEELQELERAEYYADHKATPPATAPPATGIIGRLRALFGRRSS